MPVLISKAMVVTMTIFSSSLFFIVHFSKLVSHSSHRGYVFDRSKFFKFASQ